MIYQGQVTLDKIKDFISETSEVYMAVHGVPESVQQRREEQRQYEEWLAQQEE